MNGPTEQSDYKQDQYLKGIGENHKKDFNKHYNNYTITKKVDAPMFIT